MDDEEEADDLPPGPLILMVADGEAFAVLIKPPLPDGDHRRSFRLKDEAWAYAMSKCQRFRLGFSDHTTGSFGRIGPNSRTLGK